MSFVFEPVEKFKSLNVPTESGQFDVGHIFQREKQRSWMNWDQFVYEASWDQLTAYNFYHHHQIHSALHSLLWRLAPLPCSPPLYACRIPRTLLLHCQVIKLTNIRLQKAIGMKFHQNERINLILQNFSFFWLSTMSFTVWNTFRQLKAAKVN